MLKKKNTVKTTGILTLARKQWNVVVCFEVTRSGPTLMNLKDLKCSDLQSSES